MTGAYSFGIEIEEHGGWIRLQGFIEPLLLGPGFVRYGDFEAVAYFCDPG